MSFPKIVAAYVIDNHTLQVEFSSCEIKRYDISKLLDNPMFSPLGNVGFFRDFRIELGGHGLVWNDEIDISEYELWRNGVSVTDEALTSIGDRSIATERR